MSTGEKIKKARHARGLTQKELGEKVGLTDVRIRQYELNNRTPKEDTLRLIAEVLEVNYHSLCEPTIDTAEEVIFSLFELEEHYPFSLHPIPVVTNDKSKEQIGITFEETWINEFLMEWKLRKKELQTGKISQKEYEEWKWNWPQTSDHCEKGIPERKWRRESESKD